MGWKDSIYKEAIEEIWSVETKVAGMHKELLKDMHVVNPTRIPSTILSWLYGNSDRQI